MVVVRAEEPESLGNWRRAAAVGGAGGSTARSVISRTVSSMTCPTVHSLVVRKTVTVLNFSFSTHGLEAMENAVKCQDTTMAAPTASCEPLASGADGD